MNTKYSSADDVREALDADVSVPWPNTMHHVWDRLVEFSEAYRIERGCPPNEAARTRFLFAAFDVHPRGVDWRVLGGVIPGPIPVEWARTGDTIRDNGVTGTITRIVNTGRMVHLYIDSGHVCFAKVTRQDWVHVISAGGAK
jgi:hypothetical protein